MPLHNERIVPSDQRHTARTGVHVHAPRTLSASVRRRSAGQIGGVVQKQSLSRAENVVNSGHFQRVSDGS